MPNEKGIRRAINKSSKFKNVTNFLFPIFIIGQVIGLSPWLIIQSIVDVEVSSAESAKPLYCIVQEVSGQFLIYINFPHREI